MGRFEGAGEWQTEGINFIGFRFDHGAGKQYGWVRIHMLGEENRYGFRVVDYAWADPGETLRTGQIQEGDAIGGTEGSLGSLALGAAGLDAWRSRRATNVK